MREVSAYYCEKHKDFKKVEEVIHEPDLKLNLMKVVAVLECGCKIWVATADACMHDALTLANTRLRVPIAVGFSKNRNSLFWVNEIEFTVVAVRFATVDSWILRGY